MTRRQTGLRVFSAETGMEILRKNQAENGILIKENTSMKSENLFSETECNTGRQRELDLAKAIPVLFLPFVHTVIECAGEETLLHGFPFVLDCFIGGPMSAPMFMFAMGIGIRFLADKSPKALCLRALKVAGIGILLNVFRFLLPYLVGYGISGDAEHFLVPLWYRFFGNDILQFAPLGILSIALFRKLKLSHGILLWIPAVTLLIGWALIGIDFISPVLNTALGYLLPTEDAAGLVVSDFPLLNWLIFPVYGYLFGYYLRRVRDKDRFYRILTPIALAVCVIYFPLAIQYEWGMFGPGENAYYHMTGYDGIVFLCVVISMLGICWAVSKYLPEPLHRFVLRISRGMTAFYCIHWVFVRVITNVILYLINGTQELPEGEIYLLSLAIGIVTTVLVFLWQDYKEGLLNRMEAAQ